MDRDTIKAAKPSGAFYLAIRIGRSIRVQSSDEGDVIARAEKRADEHLQAGAIDEWQSGRTASL